MPRITLLTAIAGLALSLPASAEIKTYSLDSFQKISASAGVKVIYEAGETQSVIAENKNNNFDKLILKTKGDTLVISRKSSNGWFGNRNRQKYTVRITAPAISSIAASSGSNVSASGIKGETVKLSSSSGSRLEAMNIDAGNVEIKSSSGSSLDAYGNCTSVALSSSSGSSIDADKLVCSSVIAKASSGSSLQAHATSTVEGSASSGASVTVIGGATDVEKSRSSGGSVTVT